MWKENYVSVVAITDSGRQSRSPAVIQRTDSLLSIRGRSRNCRRSRLLIYDRALPVRVPMPRSLPVKVRVEVEGLPAALLVQTDFRRDSRRPPPRLWWRTLSPIRHPGPFLPRSLKPSPSETSRPAVASDLAMAGKVSDSSRRPAISRWQPGPMSCRASPNNPLKPRLGRSQPRSQGGLNAWANRVLT